MSPQEKLKSIREELKQTFLERGELIDGALSALLSSNHLLIIGPPGTAKSMLADELCRRIEGANYFQWLLTRFTTPEEIFGAVSLKALEEDDYRRVTDRKLPEAHIAFLDEIFKANSSILNAILTLINERLFHNGKSIVRVPLLTLFGVVLMATLMARGINGSILIGILVGSGIGILTGVIPLPSEGVRLSTATFFELDFGALQRWLERVGARDAVRATWR